MSPREVIARALCARSFAKPDKSAIDEEWPHWLGEADAVIDALEGMGITEAMERAGTKPSPRFQSRSETAKTIWRAMVGAMRDE